MKRLALPHEHTMALGAVLCDFQETSSYDLAHIRSRCTTESANGEEEKQGMFKDKIRLVCFGVIMLPNIRLAYNNC